MKKLMNKKGFTLAELLIVVAIIGVLTVVAVPVFTAQLEKSRVATDEANMRSAKALAVAAYLNDNTIGVDATGKTTWFHADTGKLGKAQPAAYGKSSGNTTKAIQVTFKLGSEPTLTWATPAEGTLDDSKLP